ncbi:MAG: 50S ribosomal protein P1 [Candidatus Diapherotrites archaeon]|jgi:large subunit ribosomal protein L12|nr:50S ribosomal protein P1 [Candidatus Diapherotrites archaeon]MBT4596416.1 50S ribosomal protein P1 [Candidatus Diapherotrites archaeon]
MEYVYAAMLLHKSGKDVDEAGVEGILKAAGVEFDNAKVKAMVAAIKNINIDEAIEKAAVAPAAAPAAAGKTEEADEEPEEDAGKKEEEAAAGLGALFG